MNLNFSSSETIDSYFRASARMLAPSDSPATVVSGSGSVSGSQPLNHEAISTLRTHCGVTGDCAVYARRAPEASYRTCTLVLYYQ